MRTFAIFIMPLLTVSFCASAEIDKKQIYNPGELKPTDSELKVKAGQKAPNFTLPSISGKKVSLADFNGKQNVVLSFVPAAWTPVCSKQWPAYNLAEDLLKERDAVILGITTDNIPSLHAWTQAMGGLWFPVLSDFNPHGETATGYGVLRSDGTAERAVFVIDKQGVIRHAKVHDINSRPKIDEIVKALDEIEKK